MKRLAVVLIALSTSLFADTSELAYFRGVMLTTNEVPPTTVQATGNATMIAHIVRNDAGRIISGSVDFIVNHAFPGATTFTGLHIHSGAAGVNGPVTIGTDLGAGAASVVSPTGVDTITRQAAATSQAALDTLTGMLNDPSQYYVNLHTTDNPGGAIRGQLQRAEVVVLMGIMSPANENPPIDSPATGISQATVIGTRNASGAWTSGSVIFDINYNFGRETTIVGFHIHTGAIGVNGPVTINTGINATTASVVTAATGVGTLRRTVEVNVTNAAQLDTLNGLFTHAKDYYINMHTVEAPGGLIRDQLRTTDLMTFNVDMLPSNENPPITGLAATAPSIVQIRTVRSENGTVLAGTTTFDVNHRFPGRTEFTGLHIHDGAVGINGPVRLNSGIAAATSVVSESGSGNIFRFFTNSAATELATLNSLVQNPELHYLNLHTTVNGGGAVRAQLTPANTALPTLTSTASGAKGTSAAVGGLITLFGSNLSKTTTGLSGWQGTVIPTSLNGVRVTIGGRNAPLLYVSPDQINAQVPVDAAGSQPVVVTTPNGSSAPLNVTIGATAPAVFAESANIATGIVQHRGGGLVTGVDPARAGEVLVIYATGLGQTTPAMTTGTLVSATAASNTATVTVTIGGVNAPVVSSVASPNSVGVYLISVTMPSGVAGGTSAPVIVTMGNASSQSVRIWVQ